MLQKISPVTYSLLAFLFCWAALSGCAVLGPQAPEKPSVELGVIDYPTNTVIVNMTAGKSFDKIDAIQKATYQNVVKAILTGGQRVPLASYDRAIAFTPGFWQVEVNYIHSLERFISNHCGPAQ